MLKARLVSREPRPEQRNLAEQASEQPNVSAKQVDPKRIDLFSITIFLVAAVAGGASTGWFLVAS